MIKYYVFHNDISPNNIFISDLSHRSKSRYIMTYALGVQKKNVSGCFHIIDEQVIGFKSITGRLSGIPKTGS